MNKDKLTSLFDDYKTRFVINSNKSGVAICNTSSNSHVYFVAQDVNSIFGDDIDSFIIYDNTANTNSKIICEYSKANDCLAFMDSIQYRKVILKLVVEKGLYTASKVIDILSKRNIKIDDDYFLDVLPLNTVFDFLFNAPLKRKPTELEAVVSVKIVNNLYEVTRGSGDIKYYSIEVDTRSKKDKKQLDENSWNQLGFICKEVM